MMPAPRIPSKLAKPPCVVIGLYNNGLGVARALGREGVPVTAIDGEPRSPHAATRYASVVGCRDMLGSGLISVLRSVGERHKERAVLIPTLDRSVFVVSEHRAQIEPYYRHSVPEDRTIQLLMNKSTIARQAESLGFDIPRSFTIAGEADLEACLAALRPPCILKPQVKSIPWEENTPKKAFRLATKEELRDTYRTVARFEPRMVVQEWIPGPDSSLIFCLYYFSQGCEPLGSFTGRKIRQFIPYCGTACSAEPCEDPWVRDAGIRFFKAVNYRGFGAIEFKRSPEGRYFLIEPTVGRTEHLFLLAAANDVNLPYLGYCDMAGLPLPACRRSQRPVKYLNWRRDFMAARVYRRAGELSLGGWLRSLRGRKVYPLFAWDDLGPMARRVFQRLLSKPRKALIKLRGILKKGSAASIAPPFSFTVPPLGALPPEASLPTPVHLQAAVDWLCAAQDSSGTGGVARAFGLKGTHRFGAGWQPPYPETTGYIIPTLLECAESLGRADLRDRALRMVEWEMAIQHPDGGFEGGVLGRGNPPVIFNTGMVLRGLAVAAKETGDPRIARSARRAAEFLVAQQDPDGAWRKFSSLEGERNVHAYDVLVSWSLLLAHQLLDEPSFRDAAARNMEFTLTLREPNGWLRSNGLRPKHDPRPPTHTIGYGAQGLLECGLLLDETRSIAAARAIGEGTMGALRADGFLSGELDSSWKPAAPWCCLTGSAQLAIVWLRLHQATGEARFREAARTVNLYLKSVQDIRSADPGIRGAVAGSHPIEGEYLSHQYPNWAAKYFIDSLLLEERCRTGAGRALGHSKQPAPGAR